MRLVISILFSLILLPTAVFSNNEQVENANTFYAEGKFKEASNSYEKVIKQDLVSADLYYNLGNAYYKQDLIPRAILNYERALKLKPDHEDALFNLAMANKKTTDKIDRLPELFIGSTWRTLVTSRTVNSWASYCVVLFLLSLVFFVGYLVLEVRLIKKVNFYAGVFFLLFGLSGWLMASQHQNILDQSAEAIIFEPPVTVLSAPNASSEKLFTLHEGTKVSLLQEVNEWQEIKLPNGNVGWVQKQVVENI